MAHDSQILYKGIHGPSLSSGTFTVITIDGTALENISSSYGAIVELYAATYSSGPYLNSVHNIAHVYRSTGNVTVHNGTPTIVGDSGVITDLSLTASGTDILVDITRDATASSVVVLVWAVVRAFTFV